MQQKGKNHLCFIGNKEFFRFDQTVRVTNQDSNIDLSNGFKIPSQFVCYLNSWEKVQDRIISGHITI